MPSCKGKAQTETITSYRTIPDSSRAWEKDIANVMPIITSREVSKGVAAMLEKTWDVWDNCHEIGVIAGKPHVKDAKVKQ